MPQTAAAKWGIDLSSLPAQLLPETQFDGLDRRRDIDRDRPNRKGAGSIPAPFKVFSLISAPEFP